MDTNDDVLKIKSNSSYSREDRLVLLKLKLTDALKNKNEDEIAYYSRLLNMYEKSNKNNELAEFLKHRNK